MTTIAIDFGTSNTVVSILNPDTKKPESLRFPQISRLFQLGKLDGNVLTMPVIPTLVFVKEAGGLVLGEQVRAQRLGLSQPHRLFKAFKRDLAADFQSPPRHLDGTSYSVQRIAELFLEQLWQQLHQHHQIQPTQVIFTVPVGAFERYSDWFRDLGKSLGAREVHLVDESTAAALGYAVQRPGTLVLVVDFGGGTLDLSLVRTSVASQEETRAEILAKSEAYIGGEDIDIWIVEDYLRRQSLSRETIGEIGFSNLQEIAEKLKMRLSDGTEAKESWLDEESFFSHELSLTRPQLEEILENQQFLERLRGCLDEVLEAALGKGISKSDIEKVILVGGSCLIPAVQQLVISYFGKQKVAWSSPFEAIAHGALALNKITVIEDYLRHSYVLRLWEPQKKTHYYLPLFESGVKYPCQREIPLVLQAAIEGQKELRLDIGEVAIIKQAEVIYDEQGRMTSSSLHKMDSYRSLEGNGQQVCIAHLSPPGSLGHDRISVFLEVDARKMLLATVKDLVTGKILAEKHPISRLE